MYYRDVWIVRSKTLTVRMWRWLKIKIFINVQHPSSQFMADSQGAGKWFTLHSYREIVITLLIGMVCYNFEYLLFLVTLILFYDFWNPQEWNFILIYFLSLTLFLKGLYHNLDKIFPKFCKIFPPLVVLNISWIKMIKLIRKKYLLINYKIVDCQHQINL